MTASPPPVTKPKPGSWIRRLPLVTGILGGSLLMLNRLAFTPDLLNSQSRADALGILLSALLILTGLLWQQSQPPPPDAVTLAGDPQIWLDPQLSEAQKLDLGWASHALLTLTGSRTVVIWHGGQVRLKRGILPPASPDGDPWQPGVIARRAMQTGRAVHLVDLKLYPARGEFTDALMPSNTCSVLCQPIGEAGVLMVGTDRPRTLTRSDQAWIQALAERLDPTLGPG